MTRYPSPRLLLVAIAGLAIWALGFSVIYGLQALACELGWAATGIAGVSLARLVLAGVWLAHMAVLAWLAQRIWAQHSNQPDGAGKLMSFVAFTGALSGLIAMLWTGLPVLATSVCI